MSDRITERERAVLRGQQALVARYAPAAWLLSADLSLLHSFNGSGRYLVQQDGSATLNILELLDGEIKFVVADALERARDHGQPVHYSGIDVRFKDGVERVDISVEMLPSNDGHAQILVTLAPLEPAQVSPPRQDGGGDDPDLSVLARERSDSLELELHHAKENLQATIEEMEASNEARIASNEELQSVNAEYQSKITELTSDMNHLFEATEVHTIFLDHELRIRRFTPRIGEIFNLLPQDLGRRLDDFIHRLDHNRLLEDLATVLRGDPVVEREVRDYNGHNYFLRILPYRPHDLIDGVVLTLVDISTLKQTEYNLRLSEERYRTLVRAVASLLWTADASGGVTTVQPEWQEYTGQTREQYWGRGWLQAIHEDERGCFTAEWDCALARGSLLTFEVRVWNAASTAYHRCLLRAAPLLTEDGEVREWVGNVVDVEDARKAEATLRERESQLAGILENSPTAIFIKDVAGHYMLVNKVTRGLFGRAESEILGKSDYELMPGRLADPLQQNDRMVLESGTAMEVEECLTVAGELRTFSSVKFPLFDDSGEIYAIAGVANDITARKVLQQRERLEARRRDRFLVMMSHELRNPLGAILNAIHVLERDDIDGQTGEHAHQVIERQAQHMARLLDDLLDISRISQGKMEMLMSDIDLTDVVREATDSARLSATRKSLALHVELPDAPLIVQGDRVRLDQVVNNLLGNAVKFTDPGGEITLTLLRDDNSAIIQVRDTGVGLEEGEEDKVFEMFYQRDTSIDRAGGGLGVGLSLTRELLAQHRGTISATSGGRGKGTTFTVALPLSNVESEERDVTRDDLRERDSLSIVLVEDNEDSRDMLQMLLERRGHEVSVARDGKEGVTVILDRCPDLALVDIGLPAMNGYEVAKAVRAASLDTPVYMVALTGYGREEDREAVLRAGFDEHIVKPIKPEDIERLTTRFGDQSAA